MSKRFIDTEIFDDSWFMELTVNAKLIYIYFITNCDHAGIIDANWKLIEFRTGIKQLTKSYESLMKEFGDRMIKLRDNYYFLPRFISFQYPGFPKSQVMQQKGAINRLKEFNLFDEELQTLNKELLNSYEYGNVNDNVNVDDDDNENNINISFENFWNLYDKKVGDKLKCEKKWNKLSDDIRQKIMDTLPKFKKQFRDKQFQPYPETYINQKRWNDEIILKVEQGKISEYKNSYEKAREILTGKSGNQDQAN